MTEHITEQSVSVTPQRTHLCLIGDSSVRALAHTEGAETLDEHVCRIVSQFADAEIEVHCYAINGASAQGLVRPDSRSRSTEYFLSWLDELHASGKMDAVAVWLGVVDLEFILPFRTYLNRGAAEDQLEASIAGLKVLLSELELRLGTRTIALLPVSAPPMGDKEMLWIVREGITAFGQPHHPETGEPVDVRALDTVRPFDQRVALIQRFNDRLARLAAKRGHAFVDTHTITLDENGTVRPEFIPKVPDHHLAPDVYGPHVLRILLDWVRSLPQSSVA